MEAATTQRNEAEDALDATSVRVFCALTVAVNAVAETSSAAADRQV